MHLDKSKNILDPLSLFTYDQITFRPYFNVKENKYEERKQYYKDLWIYVLYPVHDLLCLYISLYGTGNEKYYFF